MISSSEKIPSAESSVRLSYIDTLRGLGAVAVFMTHVHAYWLNSVRPSGFNLTHAVAFLAGLGGLGVDLFIVLSGFCLFYPLLSRTQNDLKPFKPKSFYRRRAYRLLPAYYAALFVAALLAFTPALQPFLVSRPVGIADVLAYLFLVQTFSPVTTASINGSFWSIALEVQLYLAFPILLLLYNRRGGIKTVIALSVATVILWPGLYGFLVARGMTPFDLLLHLPAHWVEFVGGMVAAMTVKRPTLNRIRTGGAIFLLTLPATIILHTGIIKNLPLWGPVLVTTACFSGLVVALSAYPERVFTGKSPLACLTFIGTISYSFYLLHQPFLLLTGSLIRSVSFGILPAFAVALFIGIPLMCLIACLSYFFIEKPFIEIGRRAVQVKEREIWAEIPTAEMTSGLMAVKVKDV